MKRKYFKTLTICIVAAMLAGSMPAPVYAAEERLVQVTEESTSQDEIVQVAEEQRMIEDAAVQEEYTIQDEEPGLPSETDAVYMEALVEVSAKVETSLDGEEDKLEVAAYSTEGSYRPYEGAVYFLNYAVVGDGITITGINRGGNNELGKLVIPEAIDGIPVTSIGESVFWGCSFTGELVIPEGVTSIGEHAFADCYSFTGELVIPATVTFIGDEAFRNCHGFTGELVIPEGVTSIGDEVFLNCDGFTGELTLPKKLTSIGESAFRFCSGFTGELVIPEGVTSIGRYAFNGCNGFSGELKLSKNLTTIGENAFSFCSGFTGELVIPAGVTSIGDYAFYGCGGFTGDLMIPEGVTNIGDYEFGWCTGFTGNLVLPMGVMSIGEGAFVGCSGFIGELVIPAGVTSIGEDAFGICSGFTGELLLPESVTSIGESAFISCSGFTGELVIPVGVTNIGGHAFSGCSGFTGDLVIPVGVVSIGDYAFYDCSGFSGELVIPAGVTSIGADAFSYCNGFTGELLIPEGVTNIGERAFAECDGFTGELVIPESMTSIEAGAFVGCTGLKYAVVLDSETLLGEGVFAETSNWNYSDNYGSYKYDGCVLSRIYGYPGSTAQAYAEQMNIPFIPLTETADVENSVKVDSTAAGVGVSVPMSEMDKRQLLSEAIANAGQSGTNQEVSLDIQVKATNLSDAEKERTQACAGAEGYTTDQALDITMILSVGGATSNVEQLVKPVRFVIEIPESLRNEERKFAVIRLHNGEAEILPDLDSEPATITIETDRFSSYTLAYKSTKGVSLSGAVVSFGDEAEAVTVKVLNGDKVVVAETYTVAETGAYQFEQLEAGKYTLVFSKASHVERKYSVTVAEENVVQDATIYLLGDVDGNGKINARDKKTIYNHIAGESELSGYEFRIGDVNGDGKINARDKKMIYNHIAGESLLW